MHPVLLVGDFLEPVDRLSVLSLGNCDMASPIIVESAIANIAVIFIRGARQVGRSKTRSCAGQFNEARRERLGRAHGMDLCLQLMNSAPNCHSIRRRSADGRIWDRATA